MALDNERTDIDRYIFLMILVLYPCIEQYLVEHGVSLQLIDKIFQRECQMPVCHPYRSNIAHLLY